MLVRALALLAALATPALAATELETFSKLLHKYAPQYNDAVALKKAPCVCVGGPNDARAGFLAHSQDAIVGTARMLQVFCFVPGFNTTTGESESLATCTDFVYLGK